MKPQTCWRCEIERIHKEALSFERESFLVYALDLVRHDDPALEDAGLIGASLLKAPRDQGRRRTARVQVPAESADLRLLDQ